MNENLSFHANDEIDELELDVYVKNVILEAQASLANVFITISSTSTATVLEQVMILTTTTTQTLVALVRVLLR